jgi:hypothetical protein
VTRTTKIEKELKMKVTHSDLVKAVEQAGKEDVTNPFRYDAVKDILRQLAPEMDARQRSAAAVRVYMRDPTPENLSRSENAAYDLVAEMQRPFKERVNRIFEGKK